MRLPTRLIVALAAGAAAATPCPAGADAPARRRAATLGEIVAGPFRSSRLFAMPVADVVGAYQLAISGDGSLLQETGILSAAGVLAIGFGDLAQLEYRHTAAISVERTTAPVPAVGVQLQLPLRERRWVPAWAIAFRLGVPRGQRFGGTTVDETVTDLYVVGRLRLGAATLHGGARVSSATIEITGDRAASASRRMVLPAAGLEVAAEPATRLVAEVGLAPQFRFEVDDPAATPAVDYGLLGRLGVRWFVHPAFSVDASLGYQLEVARMRAADGLGAVTQWDIRLGGELFVPWGALVCRAAGAFCE